MDLIGKKTLEIMNKAPWYNGWLYSRISPFLGGQILEIGAGIGNFTKLLSKKGQVTAIDYDKTYLSYLKRLVGGRAGWGDIEKGKYFFRKKKFDSIVCMNVLEHIKNDKRALSNMRDLLKDEGRLVLLVPAHQFAYGLIDRDLGHYRRYTRDSLDVKLVSVGFKVKKIFYLNFLGLAGWWFNGKILKKRVIPSSQLGIFDLVSRPFLKLEEILYLPFGLSVVAVAYKK